VVKLGVFDDESRRSIAVAERSAREGSARRIRERVNVEQVDKKGERWIEDERLMDGSNA
jgi:hypothetical protein